MEQTRDFLLMLVVLLGLATLGSNTVVRCIRIVAVQGTILGVLLILTHIEGLSFHLVGIALLSIAVKGAVIPWLLFRSIREANVRREIEPYIGFAFSMVLGIAALGAAFGLAGLLPLPHAVDSHLIVPVSLATVFIGFLLLVTRKRAIMQVVGYLVLENGIFVFSLALAGEVPVLVEMGVLLDLFAGAFVMGIIIYQINREFDHIDAHKLQQLHDMWDRKRARRSRLPVNGRRQETADAVSQGAVKP